ncbi:hypothetical protein MBBAR_3c00920 [Methanobrevibacter arboriphilus JCM 13429 = DSM 1125]|uniref:Uncharacterized protein n=1 Tax=Methanobrevibacter arboriphilus JCM 13429 = DSM 1125 TaxID=1300164 RepID=A0A1V6N4N6_METAZ|nr:hypothetical protein [Methanobrevibacter arboriphilus]OQD59436.1 hypothetical protein MBBAR_3c00920 [Methanobrevibacter arboriphilus JCM 13429 = DSM 1125]
MKRLLDKFNFIFLSFVYFIAVSLILYFIDLNLKIIFFVGSIIIWFLIFLYRDVFIPRIPKLVLLFFSILVMGCIFLFNLDIFYSFFCLAIVYSLMESYYNPDISNVDRFKNWKNNASILIIVIGGVFLSAVLAYLIFSALSFI